MNLYMSPLLYCFNSVSPHGKGLYTNVAKTAVKVSVYNPAGYNRAGGKKGAPNPFMLSKFLLGLHKCNSVAGTKIQDTCPEAR